MNQDPRPIVYKSFKKAGEAGCYNCGKPFDSMEAIPTRFGWMNICKDCGRKTHFRVFYGK